MSFTATDHRKEEPLRLSTHTLIYHIIRTPVCRLGGQLRYLCVIVRTVGDYADRLDKKSIFILEYKSVTSFHISDESHGFNEQVDTEIRETHIHILNMSLEINIILKLQAHRSLRVIEMWNRKITRADRTLKLKDHNEFLRRLIGKTHPHKLCKPKLIAEAILTIFPNLPEYLIIIGLVKFRKRLMRVKQIILCQSCITVHHIQVYE
ncbi:hypothetical protein AGLY_012467 [Aphis glycines]|uniref:Uncharacterized protein n=1 Tax=Aphis glycines TaxID=307491 RepID=A0A6G0TB35_APHGL|nr:hypothetical protein AGLY_012467 [Aphis glycines]